MSLSRAARSAAGALCLVAVIGAANAQTRSEFAPSVVAAVPGSKDDVGAAILVGRSGQLYKRVGENQWERDNVGGVAVDVLGLIKGKGRNLVAVGSYSPIFEFDGTVWSAKPLANRGRVRMSRGSKTNAFSVGRHVYVFKSGTPERLISARRTISALWASSANKIYVATVKGQLLRTNGQSWVTLTNPLPQDDPIQELYGAPGVDLYGRSKVGVIVRVSNSGATVVPAEGDLTNLDIHVSGTGPKGELLFAGTVGEAETRKAVLLQSKKAGLSIREPLWTLAGKDRFSVIIADSKDQLLVSSRRGSVRIRTKDGQWVEGKVSGKVPAGASRSFDSSTPARSR